MSDTSSTESPGNSVGQDPSEEARRAAAQPLLTSGPYKLRRTRHGLMMFLRNDVYIGGALDIYGESNEAELKLLGQIIRPGQAVLDIGANIGVHSLFFAKLVGPSGALLSIEPQRIAFQLLCANLALNGVVNAQTIHAAAAASPGDLRIPALDVNKRDNFGGVSVTSEEEGERVQAITVDSLNLTQCHFMKIDVEGYERDVLRGAQSTIARHRPFLYLENDRREKSPALLEYLFALDYRLYWHLPPLFNPENYYGVERDIFGRILSVNLLAVPGERDVKVQDLRQITSLDDWWKAAPAASEAAAEP